MRRLAAVPFVSPASSLVAHDDLKAKFVGVTD